MRKLPPKMLTFTDALSYLQQRGIVVTYQALHAFIKRHRDQCQRLGGSEKKAGMWLIPVPLLRSYCPNPIRRKAGLANRAKSSSFVYAKKEKDFSASPDLSPMKIMRPPIIKKQG